MAQMLRSISFKIFGVSVGLLLMMVAAAVWSARSTELVHRQLQTLEQSLFPLAGTLARLNSVVLSQKATANYLTNTPDAQAVQLCRDQAARQAQEADALLAQALKFRARGAGIAVMERNKLALARLEPMVRELDYQEKRLSQMTRRACEASADAVQLNLARQQADQVARLAGSIATEIDAFVITGAGIVTQNQQIAQRATILMISSAALVGIMLAWLVSRGLTRPILRLQAGARAVGAGRLDQAHVKVTSRDEIGDVTQAFNAMIDDLREKDRIKETFGQYVDPRIVAGLIDGARNSSVGEKKIATLFFSDVVKFSAIAERLAPSTLVDLMNAYFSTMSRPIRDQYGIIDKYIGDAIMAFWVPPFVDATRQAEFACHAALQQVALLDEFRKGVPDVIGLRRDVPLIDFRIGLSTGEVVVGSVGSDTARSFTVMGDIVNQASRLEAVNKVYGTRVLMDHETCMMAGSAFETRQIDEITVAGRIEPLRIHELAALAGDLPPNTRKLFDLHAEGLEHYQRGNWAKSTAALEAALAIAPNDGPSKTLLSRIPDLRQAPAAAWSGVWQMTSK